MSLSTLISRPCVIVYRSESGDTDDYGNDLPTETRVDSVCEVQQVRRDEPGDQGETSDTRWDGFFLPGTDLRTADAVEVEGIGTFELVGDPWEADSGSSGVHHAEASLRLVRGSDEAS